MPPEDPSVPVVDDAVVDDAVLMIAAATAELLGVAIDALLIPLQRVYRLLAMTINWKPGKTEGMLLYRGSDAQRRMHARRPSPTAAPSIAIPGTDQRVLLVDCYKHLGGEIHIGGSIIELANGHRKAALNAYAPLASKISGP